MENRENIEELLSSAGKDKSAAIALLKCFSSDMYKEARLYVSDQQLAKDLILQAFRNVRKELSSTNADTVGQLLTKSVQTECIKNALPLEIHSSSHTSEDEIPDARVRVSSDTEKVRKQLRALLNKLTPSERVVCVLKYRDRLTNQEIAEKCGISEEQAGYILTDTKQTLSSAGISAGVVLAYVNQIFPVDKPQKKTAVKEKKSLSEEELFNSSVLELKEFFNTRTISRKEITDQGIDEGEYVQNDVPEEESSEDENTAMIVTAALSAESDKKKHDEKYNPVTYWVKRIVLILIISLIAFGLGTLLSILHSNKEANNAKEPEITETAEAEETAEIEESEEPQETPEPESTSQADLTVGKAYILVTDLSIRTGAGVSFERVGLAEVEKTYDVYEMKDSDGYIWYRIGEDQWVPDFQGQYVTYTPNA